MIKECYICHKEIEGKLGKDYYYLGKDREGNERYRHLNCSILPSEGNPKCSTRLKREVTLTNEKLQEYCNTYANIKKKYEVIVQLHKLNESYANIVEVIKTLFNTPQQKAETYVKMVFYKLRKGILK